MTQRTTDDVVDMLSAAAGCLVDGLDTGEHGDKRFIRCSLVDGQRFALTVPVSTSWASLADKLAEQLKPECSNG